MNSYHYQRISCNAEIVQVRALARDGKDPITGTFEEDFSGKLRSSNWTKVMFNVNILLLVQQKK